MAKTVNSSGTGTLPVSGPDTISSVVITDGSVAAGDKIIVTKTTSVSDVRGPFDIYTEASASAGSFTAYADKKQLPTAMNFHYITVA